MRRRAKTVIEFDSDYEHSPTVSDFIDNEADDYKEVFQFTHDRPKSKVIRVVIDPSARSFDYSQHVDQLTRKVHQLKATISQNKNEISRLNQKVTGLMQEIGIVREESEWKIRSYHSKIAEANTFLREKESILAVCNTLKLERDKVLDEKSTEVRVLQCSLEELRTKLRAETACKVEAIREVSCLQKSKDELNHEKSLLLARISTLETTLPGLQGSQFDSVPLDTCNQLLSQYIESISKLNRAIQAKIEALSIDVKCVVCMSACRSVLLQPCSHHCLCQACSHRVSKCPLCRSPITIRILIKGS